ncbi:hypothetical protein [Pseudoalteromonas lipolytica]|uniref:Uncharacterized protein n=2 Tax=Pseudoalteromonas lipolytica TaxID=570156 RepID=A0ABY1GRV8_9GAMM|nr:hypothetical protein [Pseudoalteromonas lipolytica]MBE0349915.1 hypothetical protein [Pseudoalteromonas lipolytica LMEB 39]SFT80751.1 hypothetical protein SAMN04487854_11084 [Pseudoalteromonas lipolytica]
MQKFDKTILAAIILVFLSGLIFGQGFSFEVKLGDILALGAALGTLWYASNGLKHNERQYLNSIMPVIEKMEYHHADFGYELKVHNYGSGSALNLEYRLFIDEEEVTFVEWKNQLIKGLHGARNYNFGGPLGIMPNTKISLIKFSAQTPQSYAELVKLISKTKIQINYENI